MTREAATIYDPVLADYAGANGWTLERDNESGGDFGGMPVFMLWAIKPDVVLAGSWFGMRSQGDAERMILPEMRYADEEAPSRAACDHAWTAEGSYEGVEACSRDCGARRIAG
jgi:hypothetical protein